MNIDPRNLVGLSISFQVCVLATTLFTQMAETSLAGTARKVSYLAYINMFCIHGHPHIIFLRWSTSVARVMGIWPVWLMTTKL